MKYLDEYRDPDAARQYVRAIHSYMTRPWSMMEICGGQTHTIVKYGIDELLPKELTLIHGPGCPVCVTPTAMIDKAVEIASRPEVIFCSFGDMLRVPGSEHDLFSVKAAGGDVRVVYSPLDAVKLARENPQRQVVFFAIGFETTAPANAMAAVQAKREGLTNFSLLVSHVLAPPAMEAILASPHNRVQGFLAAGHVCTVMGTGEYEPLVRTYRVPIVVTGFELLDMLQGIYLCIKQLEEGRAEVENQYARSVRREGNPDPGRRRRGRNDGGRGHRRDPRDRPASGPLRGAGRLVLPPSRRRLWRICTVPLHRRRGSLPGLQRGPPAACPAGRPPR